MVLVSGIDIFHLRKQPDRTGLSGMKLFFHQDLLFITLNHMYVYVQVIISLDPVDYEGNF